MRPSLWIAALWPGFPRAWLLGRWEGLVLAAAFSVALQFGLLTSVLGTPIAGGATIAWTLCGVLWITGILMFRQDLGRLATSHRVHNDSDSTLREAQQQYLKGHWTEAELAVRRLLVADNADVEARLLLAAIQRRQRRSEEARRTLMDLRQEPIAAKWALEIERELRQLEELEPQGLQAEIRKAA
jgi:hypothetical protein